LKKNALKRRKGHRHYQHWLDKRTILGVIESHGLQLAA